MSCKKCKDWGYLFLGIKNNKNIVKKCPDCKGKITVNKKVFIGNCVNGLNDEQFREYIADDSTLLAQLVEDSEQISKREFLKNCSVEITLKKHFEYFYNRDEEIYFYRDVKRDVEYFYI